MRAYYSTLNEFYNDIRKNIIVEKIIQQTNMNFGESQIRAFKNSLPAISNALQNENFDSNLEVAIELRIPLTNKRIDFMIAGSDEFDNDHVIIIELKQRDKVEHTNMPDIVKVDYYGGKKDEVHPSWQAYTYESTIQNFNEYVDKNKIQISSCAFLHNYKRNYLNELTNPIYKEGIEKSSPFISDQYESLANFIHHYIKKASKNKILFEISEGRIKPSKMLTESLSKMLNGNDEFCLIDEQRIVYSNIFNEIKTNLKDNRKHVFIIKGGPGTGKTVIAMSLLSQLIKEKGMKAFYVSKSSYLKESYFKKLTRDTPNYKFLRTLFLGSGNFIDSTNNEFDCLIVDEAHRLTEKTKRSYLYYGENQIKEIIHASKFSIFFIDETQQIDIKDYGTIENITRFAIKENAVVHNNDKFKLISQFRCNGSDEYLSWIEAILYNKEFIKSGEKVDYEIKIFDDALSLAEAIKEKNNTKISRIFSGDVFPWKSRLYSSTKFQNLTKEEMDINIGEFSAVWNKSKDFAVNPNSINEVGCIHTGQGMEFDYIGLIVGDDLIYKNGLVMTDFTKHPLKSNEFKRPHKQKIDPNDYLIIDKLIRNTYKVLFTRGLKGIYLLLLSKLFKDDFCILF